MASTGRLPKNTFTIRVKRVDDAKHPIERKSCGLTTGMGICEYAASLLEVNEKLPASKKMSDATLEVLMIQEFPGRKSMERLAAHKTTMGYWRTLYNLGKLTGGKIPATKSVRYSLTGMVRKPRHSRKKKASK